MIENNQAIVLWNRCLNFIKDNINNARAFETWFEPIVPLKYENKALTIGVPSPFFYEYLEEKYVGLLRAAIYKEIGEGTEFICFASSSACTQCQQGAQPITSCGSPRSGSASEPELQF